MGGNTKFKGEAKRSPDTFQVNQTTVERKRAAGTTHPARALTDLKG